MKNIFIEIEKCLACKSCELACAVEHSVSHNLYFAIKEQFLPMKRIYIEETVFPLPLLRCCECDDAPCMDACIVEALYYDESLHIVCIDENKCVGCWMCIMVCPFGAIMPDINKKVAYKCDLCKDREQLACINACPTGALIYCETEKLLNNKRRKIAKKIKL